MYLIVLLMLDATGVISISRQNVLWSALFLDDTGFPDSNDWFVAHT
jgi:hypothetical protein